MIRHLFLCLLIAFAPFLVNAQTPVPMASQPSQTFTADFADISNWTINGTTGSFTAGIGSAPWKGNASGGTTTIPNPVNLTTNSRAFTTGTTSGIQKGTGNLLFIASGPSANSASLGVDLFLDFTGTVAGTLSLDLATVNNGAGDRQGALHVYASVDGTSWNEITTPNLPYVATNNVVGGLSFSNLPLPASFNNSASARLRFYYHNGPTNGTTGNVPKISLDNVVITATPGATPVLTIDPSSINFPTTNINTTSTEQSFTVTGENLIAPVIVTTSAPYSVCATSNGVYSTSISIPAASVVSPKTVYVRFRPTTAGVFSGSVFVNSTNAAQRIVSVVGSGFNPAAPGLFVSPATINFPETIVGSNSGSEVYTLTAGNLTNDITITASSSFAVSTDDATYSSSLTIVKTDPDLPTGKIIYIKFVPIGSGAIAGTVTNVSAGVTSKTITVSGKAIGLIDLAGFSYEQNFDGIGSGLPTGITGRADASDVAVGAELPFTATPVLWNNTTGAFKNYASGNNAQSVTQNTATDRAFGVRQAGAFADPGAAFVFQVSNTAGKFNFTMDFKLQSLDATSGKSTTWQVDYGIGLEPTSFTVPAVTGNLVTGATSYTNNSIHVDFGNALDDISDVITIRIVALNSATGSGSQPSTGIDDFKLLWEDPFAKTITLSTNTLSFPTTPVGSTSTATYTIVEQTNLDQPIDIVATGPFYLSEDNIIFTTSLSIDPATAFDKVIYVQYSPLIEGESSGTITHSSDGGPTAVITATALNPVPVRLTTFDATPVNNTVQLTWNTASEEDNNYFQVERSVGNPGNFVSIGKVKGRGNSGVSTNYSLIDAAPFAGINYYRLKQVDIDGKSTYSKVALVRLGNDKITKLLVYPNPVSNQVTLNLNGSTSKYNMQLTAADGRVVIEAKGTISELNVVLNNHVNQLRRGMYIVQLRNREETYSSKLIKE